MFSPPVFYFCLFSGTARFGHALTRRGALKLKHMDYENDHQPIEKDCTCYTCKTHSRAYLSRLLRQKETVGCHYISIHNIAYQMRLMQDIRRSIVADQYPEFIRSFMKKYFLERESLAVVDDPDGETSKVNDPGKLKRDGYPVWIINALESLGIILLK